jgi:SOS response regulatory protein OraA/RecX
MKPEVIRQLIDQAHRLYCQQTGQRIRMRMDRQRMWYELIRNGFTLQEIKKVIT